MVGFLGQRDGKVSGRHLLSSVLMTPKGEERAVMGVGAGREEGGETVVSI